MTNEQVWHESTVMERCEILKSRLDLMEQAQLDWVTSEPGWFVSKDELARLRRIEEAADRLGKTDFSLNGVGWPRAMRLVNELREALKR